MKRASAEISLRPELPFKAAAGVWLSWLVPLAFLQWLYSSSFRIWWREDDFPLLGFVGRAHGVHDLFGILLSPYAQGTIRPLSERLPFLLCVVFFNYASLPLRILVFATVVCDLLLINWLTHRLTKSRVAGCAAAVFWIASASVASPMTWNSAYNEVQLPAFLLGALACFMRYADTGRLRFWWAQFAIFVFGFGSLEINVVYPAIAAVWVLTLAECNKTRLLAATTPMFLVSTAYSLIHLNYAPVVHDGPYSFRVDSGLWQKLWQYSRWALLSPKWLEFGHSQFWGSAILLISGSALVAFALWQIAHGRMLPVFSMMWFLLTLAPMLPLPNRNEQYYLTIPAIGLAFLAGWAVNVAWNSAVIWRLTSLLPIIAWFCGMIPVVRETVRIYVAESKMSKNLILGVQAARTANPGKAILVDGVSEDLYRVAVYESGFRYVGLDDVYLTAENAASVHALPPQSLDPATALNCLEGNRALVYTVDGNHLSDTTAKYASMLRSRRADSVPRHVEIGDRLYAYVLGPEWMDQINDARWMPGVATLKIGAPENPGALLSVEGWCIKEHMQHGPLHVEISADGVSLGERQENDTHFFNEFALPDRLVGKKYLTLKLRVHPTIRIGDKEYGALFSRFNIFNRPAPASR